MAKTITEIATMVLHKIKRLPFNQTALPGHVKIIQDAYADLHSELQEDGLVNWTSSDDIPDLCAYPVTIMLCGRVADDFQVQDKWTIFEPGMRKRIAKNLPGTHVPETTQFENF